MRIVVYDDHKEVFLTNEEAMELCKPGEGANTCIWLVMGRKGWECLYFWRNEGRNLIGETLEERWRAGKTVAKRDGCEKIKKEVLDESSANKPY